jgi:hypothetical protein
MVVAVYLCLTPNSVYLILVPDREEALGRALFERSARKAAFWRFSSVRDRPARGDLARLLLAVDRHCLEHARPFCNHLKR